MCKNTIKNSDFIESLESRRLLAGFALKVNFQPETSPVPDYYRADTGAAYGLRANGLTYGWSADNRVNARDRDAAISPDQRYDTFNHMQKSGTFAWEALVPNGRYAVRVVAGDAGYYDSVYKIAVEGTTVVSGTPSSSKRWIEGSSIINVSDGRLTISNASGAVNNKIAFVEITADTGEAIGTLAWTRAASHIARTEQMTAFVGSKMYVLGGYLNQSYLSVARMDAYDPATNTWARLADMPQRLSHSAAAADDRYIYLAGGYTVNAAGTQQVFGLRTARRYDTVSGQWSMLPDLPASLGAASMVVLDRKLYFMGGQDSRMIASANVWTLDLNNPSPTWTARAPMPEGNNHFGAAVLGGQIYTIGGQSGNDNTAVFKRSCYRYDPSANAWSAIASLPSPARSHIGTTTLVYKGRIFAMGGESDGPAVGRVASLRNVAVYDPATNTWSAQTQLPAARSGGVAAVWGQKIIFSVGLSFGTFCSDTWIGDFR